MGNVLKVTLKRDGDTNEIELFNGEVGKHSWTDDGAGGFSVTAAAPRAAGAPNPALAGLSDALKAKKAASA